MMAAGGILYGILGFFVIRSAPLSQPGIARIGFGSVVLLAAAAVTVARQRPTTADHPSDLLALWLLAAFVHAAFGFPIGASPVLHGVVVLCMFVGAVDALAILRPRPGRALLIGVVLLTGVALLTQSSFKISVTLVPVGLLLLWKLLLGRRVRENRERRDHQRKLEAFRATVVSLNHEFNNVVGICDAVLLKIKAGEGAGARAGDEDLEILERNLGRLVRRIKALRKLDRYEEVVYLGETRMVDVPEETN